MKRIVIGALALLGAGPAMAAAPLCTPPARLSVPHEEGPSESQPRRVMPIGSYTLALIWLPENCRKGSSPGTDALDCRAGAGRNGFVLHGLWPDGEGKDWPQWCAPARPLSPATLRAHYCATPSTQLAQHEWTKHGTCMTGYDPDRYFAVSRSLFAGLRMPDLRALSYRRPTRGLVQRAFAAANPGMTAEMINLNVNKNGWLEEAWICLDRRMRRAACPAPIGKPGDAVKIWRGGRRR